MNNDELIQHEQLPTVNRYDSVNLSATNRLSS